MKKIIIADDNIAWCNIMNNFLQQYSDFQVIGTTTDGNEQIEMIQNLKPDIVITDLKRNSGISGLEVIQKCNDNTTFVVETASDYNIINSLVHLGIKDFLIKPFQLSELVQKIQERTF